MWSKPQPVQLVFRDQPLHQAMYRLERAGVLDAQARQRIDVEEAAVVDLAGGQPPVAELVVLAFQQQMQRLGLRRPAFAGAIGVEPACDDLSRRRNVFQRGLERRRSRRGRAGAARRSCAIRASMARPGALSSASACLTMMRRISR